MGPGKGDRAKKRERGKHTKNDWELTKGDPETQTPFRKGALPSYCGVITREDEPTTFLRHGGELYPSRPDMAN